MYIFTIFDTVAQRGGNLFMTNTMGEAERQFTDAIVHAQDGSLFKTHPESFQLWFLGEFREDMPFLHDIDEPKNIMEGKAALEMALSDKVTTPEGN